MYFSAGYLVDYAVGLLVAVHIFVVDQLMNYWRCGQPSKTMNCLTRFLADRSFSVYAFHMPLLYLAAVSLPYQKDNPLQVAAVLTLVLMIVLVLHWVSEKRRPAWQQAALRTLRYLQGLRVPASAR